MLITALYCFINYIHYVTAKGCRTKEKQMSEKTKCCNPRLGTVGGQAVLEGIMMRHKDSYSVSVRREDGSIVTTDNTFVSIRKKYKFLNIPIIRGAVNFVEMMMLSYKTLSISAEAYGIDEEEEESRFEKWLREKFGKGLVDVVMVIAMVLGLGLGFGIFFFLPIWLTGLANDLSGDRLGWFRNVVEGVIKVVIFVLYLWLTSLMPEIRRTFEYHGAEHKSIFCYEAGEELTPENAKRFKRFHPRCGTSFMFVIIIISILIYSLPFVTWDNMVLRFVTKLLMLPIVVGIGYEFLMYAGKHNNAVIRALSAPGLLMQRITTREPSLDQLEVAIEALKSCMPEQFPEHAAARAAAADEKEAGADKAPSGEIEDATELAEAQPEGNTETEQTEPENKDNKTETENTEL